MELNSHWTVSCNETKESKSTKDQENILISLLQVADFLVLDGKWNVTIKWAFHSCGISDLTEQISLFYKCKQTVSLHKTFRFGSMILFNHSSTVVDLLVLHLLMSS